MPQNPICFDLEIRYAPHCSADALHYTEENEGFTNEALNIAPIFFIIIDSGDSLPILLTWRGEKHRVTH